nr:hypothetical protein Iba_chr01aCG13440 [Ipomoea batatas]
MIISFSGLSGINPGKFLIKCVIDVVKKDMPHISGLKASDNHVFFRHDSHPISSQISSLWLMLKWPSTRRDSHLQRISAVWRLETLSMNPTNAMLGIRGLIVPLYKGIVPEEGNSRRLRKGSGRIVLSFFLPSKPVARITTSASSFVPSSNSTPPSQNHHFEEALLNWIFPLSASWKKFSGKIAIWQDA